MIVFHPVIRQWFNEKYGAPTDIQSMAWPRIAADEHLLITAPTGSGKTLAAFLWTLNRFATGNLHTGGTRVLYISPLKALNNDIRRNLLEPLKELKARFEQAGEEFPRVRVATRSGDTSPDDRRRMLQDPPEILITTPESLNLLLSSRGGRKLLYDIDTLILDEIHSLVDSKRGVYLMSAVERLVPMSGEFQRLALSATVNPLRMVADFIAGYTRQGGSYEKRRVGILASNTAKQYDLSIRYPPAAANRGEDEKIWDLLAEDLLPRIHHNQSTLIFVNSRALCEKLAFKINTAAGHLLAYAHHGSLSREIRAEVEARLKAGRLKAIVATSSLEMGIDIGALDEVILIQSPGSITSCIQRIGRAGHQVGASSRCTIYPTHPRDFIEAAVLVDAVKKQALEPIETINNPLDVLSQVIISMTGIESRDMDELYAELKCAMPYRNLSRREFDLVLDMLLGRYADHHIRELKPRLRIDRASNKIEAKKGALLSLYLSGGVIPDRGYFQLRHEKDNARIGELDEEFVWEANPGQVFSLGAQTWRVKKITHNDVIVGPAGSGTSAPPFWRAEPLNRSFHYATRINEFLESANHRLEEESFRRRLIDECCAETLVADEILSFLRRQKAHCDCDLPHRHHLLFEYIETGPGPAAGRQLVLHTGWGSRVNRPLALALEAAWREKFGDQPEVYVANESIVVQLAHEISARQLLDMVPPHRLEELLRKRLEGSGFFGARFRENAGRSLLLNKGKFNERKPLWMSRLQSQKLMDSVLKFEDFPLLLETWRTCLQDEFDMDGLRLMLSETESGKITITEVTTATPSPFAQSVAWGQINTYMYMSDNPRTTRTSNLRQGLLKELVFSSGLRPAIDANLAADFERQRRRLNSGYLPLDDDDLKDWVGERSLLPGDEWRQLIAGLTFTPDLTRYSVMAQGNCVVIAEDEERVSRLLADPAGNDEDFEVLISNWLQYYGPVTPERISRLLGVANEHLIGPLQSLADNNELVSGALLSDNVANSAADCFCDADNYEYLLRLQRASFRPSVEARPGEALTSFMFSWQTRHATGSLSEQLQEHLERLRGVPLTASLWESEVLPARLTDYETGQMDLLFQAGDFQWLGLGHKTVTFGFTGDSELFLEPSANTESLSLITDHYAKYNFGNLLDKTGLGATELAARLWQETWQSLVTNDSVAALRTGIQNDFKVNDPFSAAGRRGKRGAFNRWRGAVPMAGHWHRLTPPGDEMDHLEQRELEKEAARLVLARYGIVFRELCARETRPLQWRSIFRALRLMELSGEVVSGRFFEGIPGPQFMTPDALGHFQGAREDKIFFINAADPVSPAGLGLPFHTGQLPRRLASNHLVFHGDRLVLTSARQGRTLQFNIPPDEKRLGDYLAVLDHLRYRSFNPVRQLTIETINDQPVLTSPYLASLEERFDVIRDHRAIVLQREP